MTSPRHSVKIVLGGTELTVSSEQPPEFTREVAAHFDAVLARIRGSGPAVDAHRAALLAGLAVTAELFQSRHPGSDTAARIAELSERLARLLPPAKRGARAAGASLPAD